MGILVDVMKKNAVVLQKPSATISVRADISTVQRKFYNALLYVAKQEIKKKNTNIFSVPLSDLKALLKKETHNNEYYIQELKDLMDKKIEYNILHKDYNEYTITHLISMLKVISRKSEKEDIIIKFELPTDIINLLVNPKGFFANINLVIVRGLQSKYSIILYELCKDYEKVEIPLMSIDEFKRLFGLKDKKAYNRISKIKERVLDPAIKELNNNSSIDFSVSYELYKTGRKYTHIKFKVKPKIQREKITQQVEDYKSLADDPDLRELLFLLPESYRKRKNCVSLLAGALQEKDKEYIKAQIEYTNEKSPKNYCGYLKQAIEKDYAGAEIIEDFEIEEQDWKKKVIGKIVVNSKTGERYKIAHIGEQDEEGYYEVRLDKIDDNTIRWFKWTEEKIKKLAGVEDEQKPS